MADALSTLLTRFGAKAVFAGLLVAIVVWGLAHLSAAPGAEVSVLWGIASYTKRSEQSRQNDNDGAPSGVSRPDVAVGEGSREWRNKLLLHMNARAIPAQEKVHDLLRGMAGTYGDEFLQITLNNWLGSGSQHARETMLQMLGSGEVEESDTLVAVCKFLDLYHESARWTSLLGMKMGYDWNSPQYQNWLRTDRSFEHDFSELAADPRYSTLSECNRFTPEWRHG